MAQFEPSIAVAFERPDRIYACSIVAYVRMARAFVYIYTRVARSVQRVAVCACALEAALEISAVPVGANPRPFVALVDICGWRDRGKGEKNCARLRKNCL